VTEDRAKRKLAAIFSADVKGYSQLMADDEEATVRTINAYREVMTSLIKEHRGRVVDAKGDNVLAEFSSVVDAVRSAVEVQKELKERNSRLPEHRRMEFRIGINLGDVIEEEGTIYGDGVNVAARLEGLAEGGGVCISRTAFDQVKNKLKLGYEYLGEHAVKNIAEPVRVYKVLMEPEAAGKVIGEVRPRKIVQRYVAVAAAVAIIVILGALAYWHFHLRLSPIELASKEKMAFPLPDKPSIAVLPFVNMSGDPQQEFFCDGVSEDIITALYSVPELFVIARNSSFTYKGKPVKVNQVAEELGVQYLLEGSVRESVGKVRITVQLIDALTGRHLWAETYDRKMEDIFALQDEITMKIITELRVKLRDTEDSRRSEPCTTNLKAYLKYLEAVKYASLGNKEDNLSAQRLAEEAIIIEPTYACAYSLLGGTHLLEVVFGSTTSPKRSIAKAKENIDKAIVLNPSLSGPHSMIAAIYRAVGQYDKAVEQAEKALTIDPSSIFSLRELATCLRFADRNEEAIPLYEKVIRHDPFSSGLQAQLGACYLNLRRFDQAIRICKRATEMNPKDLFAHLYLTAAYAAAGREEESHATAKKILGIDPKFSVETLSKRFFTKNQDSKELFFDSLRKAGLK